MATRIMGPGPGPGSGRCEWPARGSPPPATSRSRCVCVCFCVCVCVCDKHKHTHLRCGRIGHVILARALRRRRRRRRKRRRRGVQPLGAAALEAGSRRMLEDTRGSLLPARVPKRRGGEGFSARSGKGVMMGTKGNDETGKGSRSIFQHIITSIFRFCRYASMVMLQSVLKWQR